MKQAKVLERPETPPEFTQSNLRLPRALWMQLKMYALNRRVTVTHVVEEALMEYLARRLR